jgi:hypothetical protein
MSYNIIIIGNIDTEDIDTVKEVYRNFTLELRIKELTGVC